MHLDGDKVDEDTDKEKLLYVIHILFAGFIFIIIFLQFNH